MAYKGLYPRAQVKCSFAECNVIMNMTGAEYRNKVKRNKTHKLYCSRKCASDEMRSTNRRKLLDEIIPS